MHMNEKVVVIEGESDIGPDKIPVVRADGNVWEQIIGKLPTLKAAFHH